MFGFLIGVPTGIAIALLTAIFFPKPWLKLLKETSEEVKKAP